MSTHYEQLEKTLEVIGGKWKSRVLYHILSGPRRTGELKRLVEGITQKMLVQNLKELENDGIIDRKMYNQVPPKVEYSLTAQGKTLIPVLEALCHWGGEFINQNVKASPTSVAIQIGAEDK